MGLVEVPFGATKKGISQMQLSHARPVATVRFDDPNLVSSAGLVPLVALTEQCDLRDLAGEHLGVATSCDLPPTARPARIIHAPVGGWEL